MGHQVKANGTIYALTGGTCLVDGTAYDILEGKTTVEGTAHAVSFGPVLLPNFADNDWETIIWACQNRAVPDTWTADGSCSKEMLIDGETYHVDIIGKDHDHYPDGTTAPLTFQVHEASTEEWRIDPLWMRPYKWSWSEMRTSTLEAYLTKMPQAVREAIREVSKETGTSAVDPAISVTEDKLFLLSEYECSGADSRYSHPGEGTPYAYYLPASNLLRQRTKLDGSLAWYWVRSPVVDEELTSVCIATNGWSNKTGSQATYSICPAFCF